MSFSPLPVHQTISKRWYTWIVLVLFGLTTLISLLSINLGALLFGYMTYYIYQRNTRAHKLYFLYAGLSVLLALYFGDLLGIAFNALIVLLVYLDYDFIRKSQQGLLQDPTTSFYQNQSQGFSYPTSNPNKAPVSPIKIEPKPPQRESSASPLNFCGNCGAKIFDNETKFCQNCGKPINN